MSDSAEGSENDLEEGIPEEQEGDSNEDSRENCEKNNLCSCSKSLVSLRKDLKNPDENSSEKSSAEEGSSGSSRIIFTIPASESGDGPVQSTSEHSRALISLKINGSFFHLIPGADENISRTSYSHMLQPSGVATISSDVSLNSSNTCIAEDGDNFFFLYRGSEEDLDEKYTRHSGGSEASQENMNISGIFVTPDISEENVIQHNVYLPPPKKDCQGSSSSLESKEFAGSSKQSGTAIGNRASKVAINEIIQDTQGPLGSNSSDASVYVKESITVVEQGLLEEVEECLQKYFEASSSEEENIARKLSQLVTNEPKISSEEYSLEEASNASLEDENSNISLDSDVESYSESEEPVENRKICLKKGCTNISCKKNKKVFFLCDTKDFQQLLKEEEDEEEDICNKDDSPENKSP